MKKATLKADVSLKSKFTYKGMKIAKGAVSHHSLYEEDSDGTRSNDDSVSLSHNIYLSLFLLLFVGTSGITALTFPGLLSRGKSFSSAHQLSIYVDPLSLLHLFVYI